MVQCYPWEFFAYSSLVILTGVLVVVISRIIMYQAAKRDTLLIWHYLVWVVAEVFFMALFYTLFEKVILHDIRFILDIFKVRKKYGTSTAPSLLGSVALLFVDGKEAPTLDSNRKPKSC
jgi:hypothetical protein